MYSINNKIPNEKLSQFCKTNHIAKLALFGSALRDELRPDSDIDLLVQFETGQAPGLMGLAKIELTLTGMLGRKVDLRTPTELSRYFRDSVLAKARTEYAA